MKAKMKADLRREVKMQEKVERERKYKEEAVLRRGIAEQGKKGKERELRKGGIEKSKVKELEQSIENVKEGAIEQGDKKLEIKNNEMIMGEKEKNNEKETERMSDKETSSQELEDRKGKVEVANNLLIQALMMEEIL